MGHAGNVRCDGRPLHAWPPCTWRRCDRVQGGQEEVVLQELIHPPNVLPLSKPYVVDFPIMIEEEMMEAIHENYVVLQFCVEKQASVKLKGSVHIHMLHELRAVMLPARVK